MTAEVIPEVRRAGDMDFDDGLSAVIAAVMRSGSVDYPTARRIVHALHDADELDSHDRERAQQAHWASLGLL